ncbi:iron(III) transport system permease protein [Cyclobacterium lianum]|uniref:Iron(III) transport system permease protein n=2 Tax=Cyclobacterium lianum TaxID=388280 RepID=A0A1M7PT71_9BACT|nr:iron(III) transport system permease protein [Cyclobacterium lianum]
MAASLLLLFFIAAPLLSIFVNLFSAPGSSWSHLTENLLVGYLQNTLLLLAGVALSTFILGVSLAWIVTNYEFPFRKHFEWLLILPLGFPGYIMAYTYTGLLDYTGPLQTFLRNQFDIQVVGSIVDIMNLPGAVFILSITLFPYVYLLSRASFLQQSRTFQDAAALLGSSNWYSFTKVALPMARPAIVGGIALAAMEVLNDYGTVKYFGVGTFTTGIFRSWFSMGDVTTAIYLAAILMLLVFSILYLEVLQRGKRRFSPVNFINKPTTRQQLSKSKTWLLTATCFLVFLGSFFIPFLQILHWVWISYESSLNSGFYLLVLRSFGLAAGSGLAVALIAVVLLYSLRLSSFSWFRSLTKIGTIGYAIPGAVIAIGIMIPVLSLDRWVFADTGQLMLSGSVSVLLFAYVVRFMAVGYHPLDAGFQKSGIQVNEASRLLGHNSWKTLLKIELPLVRASFFSAILLVFVDVLKELPLTLILRPFNYHTLATKAFDMATNEMIAESANSALIIILTGIFPIIFLNRVIRKANM